MTLIDELVLLGTGMVAIYLLWRFAIAYRETEARFYLYYMVSFTVLFVAVLLLMIFTYAALGNPLVVIVAALIPTGIALGLVTQFFPEYEKRLLAITVVALIALTVTRFTSPSGLATPVLILTHSVSGVIILGLPGLMVIQRKASGGFLMVAVGGLLVDVGGIALAFLKSGRQFAFFSEPVVFAVLAPLLFLMTLAFTWGFVKQARSVQPG